MICDYLPLEKKPLDWDELREIYNDLGLKLVIDWDWLRLSCEVLSIEWDHLSLICVPQFWNHMNCDWLTTIYLALKLMINWDWLRLSWSCEVLSISRENPNLICDNSFLEINCDWLTMICLWSLW